jgi:hypothetical protein
MRNSVTRLFLLATPFVLGTLGAIGANALAYPGGDVQDDSKNKPAASVSGSAQAPAGPLPPTPPPGPPSAEATNAKKLYEAEKWYDAAIALASVAKGESNDDEGNKQIAQFNLAKVLYKLKYFQGAYSIFIDISNKPNHLKFNETLLWLAKLATDLPESADVIEHVGQYNDEAIARFHNDQQNELYWELNYLLGRFKYRNNQNDQALALFEKVDRQSKYYIKAQFFIAVTNVKQRQSKPAVEAFQRVLGAIEEGSTGVEDEARMRDLAFLNMARTFYSSSIKLDEQTNAPTVDPIRLSAAVKYWNKVDQASEYWLDALLEESWAYLMAGDYSHALGNIHTIESPYFPNSYYSEGEVIKAFIYFVNCQYDDASILVSQLRAKYEPIRDELQRILGQFPEGQDEAFFKFLKAVRSGNMSSVPASQRPKPFVVPVIQNALSDRELLRHIEYVRVLDEEAARFGKAKSDFKASAAGEGVKDAILAARASAVTAAGQTARERYQRYLDDLNENLTKGQELTVDITQSQLNQLSEVMAGAQVKQSEAAANIVTPDEEHVIWPFNGEYWRDELGFYRQSIGSKCGR